MSTRRKTKTSDRKEEFLDRELPCKLEREDYEQKGAELGKELDALDVARAIAKQAATGHKAEIASHERRVAKLGRILREGQEERLVRCSKVIDYVAGEVTVTRTDTGEVLEHRALLAHEMQKELMPGGIGVKDEEDDDE